MDKYSLYVCMYVCVTLELAHYTHHAYASVTLRNVTARALSKGRRSWQPTPIAIYCIYICLVGKCTSGGNT